jgi:hypothetical protein
MFERLFPNIAKATRDWTGGKWVAAPVVIFFAWAMIYSVARYFTEAAGWVTPTVFM